MSFPHLLETGASVSTRGELFRSHRLSELGLGPLPRGIELEARIVASWIVESQIVVCYIAVESLPVRTALLRPITVLLRLNHLASTRREMDCLRLTSGGWMEGLTVIPLPGEIVEETLTAMAG